MKNAAAFVAAAITWLWAYSYFVNHWPWNEWGTAPEWAKLPIAVTGPVGAIVVGMIAAVAAKRWWK